MVAEQLQARGIGDPRVLDAMRRVPREVFVGDADRLRAYTDRALPIEAGQTLGVVAERSRLELMSLASFCRETHEPSFWRCCGAGF